MPVSPEDNIFANPTDLLLALVWNADQMLVRVALHRAVEFLSEEEDIDTLSILNIFAQNLVYGDDFWESEHERRYNQMPSPEQIEEIVRGARKDLGITEDKKEE